MPAESRSREGTLLALLVLLQAAIVWHFASRSYFFADDFVNFINADQGALRPTFLAGDQFTHFAPGHRLVTLLISRTAGFDFGFALGVLVAVQSVGVVLLQRILQQLFGAVWWTFALAFAYGISIVLMPSLQWYSAGLVTLPAAAFSLASIHAHLCWRRTGRWGWLAWSIVAIGGAALFYEKAVLVPVWLVLMRLLLLDPRAPLRECARALVREWRIWALYAIPVATYLIVYRTRSYTQPWQASSLDSVIDYLRIAWLDGFVPALFGVRVTAHSVVSIHTGAVIACQLALIALVAFSIARRPWAWRAWAFLGIAFVLNALIVLPRLKVLGPEIGYALRYDTELAFLFPIALACAFALPRGLAGSREERGSPAVPSLPSPAVAGAAAVALAAYAGVTFASDAAIVRELPTRYSRSWVDNIRHDGEALRESGVQLVLLDTQAPASILPFWIQPGANRLSQTVPLFLKDVRFNEVSDHTFRAGSDGHLRPVVFRPVLGGNVSRLAADGILTVTGATPQERRGELCVSAPRAFASIEVLPPRVLRGHEWYLHSTYRTDGGALLLNVNRGVPYPARFDRGLPGRPREGTTLTELGALPKGPPKFGGFRVDVPPGRRACFTRFVVGWYGG
jgi:hypothetical protein